MSLERRSRRAAIATVREWTPSFTQAGVYTIPFHVSDGTNDSATDLTLTVLNANGAPVFDHSGECVGATIHIRGYPISWWLRGWRSVRNVIE